MAYICRPYAPHWHSSIPEPAKLGGDSHTGAPHMLKVPEPSLQAQLFQYLQLFVESNLLPLHDLVVFR